MPFVIGLVLAAIYRLVNAITNLVIELLGEAGRRLSRAYVAGYAVVPFDTQPGDTIESDELLVSRDPISLGLLIGSGNVGRVAMVRGVRSRARMRGRWWTATSAQLIEVLPEWVALGPSGDLAVEVINSSADLPHGRVGGVPAKLDDYAVTMATFGDEWRLTVWSSIRQATQMVINRRLATELMPSDDGDLSDAELEKLELEFQRRVAAWQGMVAVTTMAALAAALVDELDGRSIRDLSDRWEQLLKFERPPLTGRRGVKGFVSRVQDFYRYLDRHATLTVIVTAALMIPGIIFLTIPTVILFLALLILNLAVAAGRRLSRGSRARGRRWRPRGDPASAPAEPHLIRRHMRTLVEHPTSLTAMRLDALLRRTTLWVARAGAAPTDVARALEWEARAGQPTLIEVRFIEGQRMALLFTGEDRHRRARLDPPVSWTTPTTLDAVFGILDQVGAEGVLVDPGHEDGVVVSREPSRAKEGDQAPVGHSDP